MMTMTLRRGAAGVGKGGCYTGNRIIHMAGGVGVSVRSFFGEKKAEEKEEVGGGGGGGDIRGIGTLRQRVLQLLEAEGKPMHNRDVYKKLTETLEPEVRETFRIPIDRSSIIDQLHAYLISTVHNTITQSQSPLRANLSMTHLKRRVLRPMAELSYIK